MPKRSGTLDVVIATQPFRIYAAPSTQGGDPELSYKCEEVEQIRDHYAMTGKEPDYMDFPTSVENVFAMQDFQTGLSPTRQQVISGTYWQNLGLDGRRPMQLILGPQVSFSGGGFSGPVTKFVDYNGRLFAIVGNQGYYWDGLVFVSLNFTWSADVVLSDLAVFNNNLYVCGKGTTTDSGGGATVSYAAQTLTDTGKAWTVNQWIGRLVYAQGFIGVVASNTATVLTLVRPWQTIPAAQSAYSIDTYIAYSRSPNPPTSFWTYADPTTSSTMPADAPRADKFTAIRYQFWKAVAPNKVYACTDPTLLTTWNSTPYLIGEQSQPINSLASYMTDLVVGKADGLWSVDRSGNDYPLLPELSTQADANNCSPLARWRTGLLLRVRNGFWRYQGSRVDSVGLDRYRAHYGTPLTVVDAAPSTNEVFVALKPITGTGFYLGCLYENPWRWHMLVADTTPSRVPTAVYVSANAYAGQSAVFVGIQDGVTYYTAHFKLPKGTDNPLDDPTYAYGASGSLLTPEFKPLPDQDKTFTKLVTEALPIGAARTQNSVAMAYALDDNIDTGTFTPMHGPQGQQTLARTEPGVPMEWFYDKEEGVFGKRIMHRITINATAAGQTSTFWIRHGVLHYKHRAYPRYRWTLGLIAEARTVGSKWAQDRRSADEILQTLLNLRLSRQPVDFEDRLGLKWKVFIEKVDHKLITRGPDAAEQGGFDRYLVQVVLLSQPRSSYDIPPPDPNQPA